MTSTKTKLYAGISKEWIGVCGLATIWSKLKMSLTKECLHAQIEKVTLALDQGWNKFYVQYWITDRKPLIITAKMVLSKRIQKGLFQLQI